MELVAASFQPIPLGKLAFEFQVSRLVILAAHFRLRSSAEAREATALRERVSVAAQPHQEMIL